MAISSKTGTITILSSDSIGTTQKITVGFQPAAIIFWCMGDRNTTDAVTNQTAIFSFGVATSTTDRRSVGSRSVHSAVNIDGGRIHRADACLCTPLATSAVDGLLDISAIDSTSFTVIIDDAFATGVRVSYLALGGSELTNAVTGTFTCPTSTGNFSTTGLAFQPNFLLMFGNAQTSDPPGTSANRSFLSVGAASSSSKRAVMAFGSGPENNATSQSKVYSNDIECMAFLADTPTTVSSRLDFVSFNSDGFTLNALEAGASFTYRVPYLALKGGLWEIGSLLTQTDTTTDIVESGFGFTPSSAMVFSHGKTESTQDTVQASGTFSIGAFDSTSSRVAQAFFDEDALATTDVATAIEHDEVYINISTAADVQGLMDIKSVDSGGFTMIMDDADPSQTFVWYFSTGSVNATITASLGALTLTGRQATITPGAKTVTASLGTLTLTGRQATVTSSTAGVTVTASLGTLALTGRQATITPGAKSVTVSLSALTLTGRQATVTPGAKSVTVSLGTLTLTGRQATVVPGAKSVTVSLGSLTIVGRQATITPGAKSVTVSLATLVLTGRQATIQSVVQVTAVLGTLSLTGRQSSIVPGAKTVTVSLGALTITGRQSTIVPGAKSVAIALGALALTGRQASVQTTVTVTASLGALALTGSQAAVVPGAKSVVASLATLTLTGRQAMVAAGTVVVASTGTISLSGRTATVSVGSVTVSVSVAALTLTSRIAFIQSGGSFVNASVGALSLVGRAASVSIGSVAVSAGVGALSLVGRQATVGALSIVNASTGALTIVGRVANITVGSVTVTASVGTVSLTGRVASVLAGSVTVDVLVVNLSLVGRQADITSVTVSGIVINANSGSLTLATYSAMVLTPADWVLADSVSHSWVLTDGLLHNWDPSDSKRHSFTVSSSEVFQWLLLSSVSHSWTMTESNQ